jgi:hypothetical protein
VDKVDLVSFQTSRAKHFVMQLEEVAVQARDLQVDWVALAPLARQRRQLQLLPELERTLHTQVLSLALVQLTPARVVVQVDSTAHRAHQEDRDRVHPV